MQRGSVVIEEIESEVLRSNPLGDSHVRQVPVYLPPGYDEAAGKRYPVIYLLAGYFGRGRQFLNVQPFEPDIAERADRLIDLGMPPVILVMPDCFTAFGGSQYLNSEATGRYEDHLVYEVVPYVDEKYRTVSAPGGRGIAGKSSGGYGALIQAMKHPELFGAVACHSADMYFEYCYKPDFPKAQRVFERAGGLESWWSGLSSKVKRDQSDFEALSVVGMAAAYSPNPDAPLGVDLPFDMYTGELRPEVWIRWLEHDPVYIVERYVDSLQGLRLLFLDCGSRDQYNLHLGARILTTRLDALGVTYEYQEFDDTHSGTTYRYDVSLPLLASALFADL